MTSSRMPSKHGLGSRDMARWKVMLMVHSILVQYLCSFGHLHKIFMRSPLSLPHLAHNGSGRIPRWVNSLRGVWCTHSSKYIWNNLWVTFKEHLRTVSKASVQWSPDTAPTSFSHFSITILGNLNIPPSALHSIYSRYEPFSGGGVLHNVKKRGWG